MLLTVNVTQRQINAIKKGSTNFPYFNLCFHFVVYGVQIFVGSGFSYQLVFIVPPDSAQLAKSG